MSLNLIQEKIQATTLSCNRDPASITLVAVSKGRSTQEIMQLYNLGNTNFAESRIQEFQKKIDLLPSEILWHFIGTLQKNKVKQAIGQFSLIHSVDTPELAIEIDRRSREAGVVTNILLQANTSNEVSKQGLTPETWLKRFDEVSQLESVKLQGWMTMAGLSANDSEIRSSFRRLRELREETGLEHLSMGMSSDFEIAIEEGATILRIGSALFE